MRENSSIKCNKSADCQYKTKDVYCYEKKKICRCHTNQIMQLDYTCPGDTTAHLVSSATPERIIQYVTKAQNVTNVVTPSSTVSSAVLSTSSPYFESSNNFWFLILIPIIISGIIVYVMWKYVFKKAIIKNKNSKLNVTPNPNYLPYRILSMYDSIRSGLQQFSKNSIIRLEMIGAGHFGEVYKGQLNFNGKNGQDGKKIAIKILKETDNLQAVDDFWNELETMSSLQHHNILSLKGFCPGDSSSSPPWMIFEYIEFGDLANVLRNSVKEYRETDSTLPILNVKNLFSCCLQISTGMEYLSERKFIHRDLACRNCLLGSNLVVKIADFGMSRDLYTCDYYKVDGKRELPVRWMSPESIMYGKFTAESDLWAYGVVLWEVYNYGKQPYYGLSNEQVVELAAKDRIYGYLDIPDNCPDVIANIMKLCWKRDTKERIRFPEICRYLCKSVDPQTGIY